MMFDTDRYYKLVRLDGKRRLIGLMPWRKRHYELEDRFRWRLVGWHPETKEGFFSDLTMRDGITRTIAFYGIPQPGSPNPIRSLNRLMTDIPADALTPQIHRAYSVSPLYRARMRKFRLGGVDIRLVLIALAICGVILFLGYYSGYLG